ncbi:DUF2163 domain-containing protein [Palleronia sp. KMU-117]|uniref:DUF2163 domain-containing protein n=1 Tax=Palleronia sp. KMU-117 TaxID=3434108 RepID=UPI003D71650D
MTDAAAALHAHLAGGITTVARCWALTRRDGRVLGFTDHDRPLSFAGLSFAADAGLSARALQQGTGLAVDNSEAVGVLSHASIREEDIRAGRFDGADVRCWLVNWRNVEERKLLFRGSIGEIRTSAGSFTAELRGMTEALNQSSGRNFQKPCGARLGDARCGVDLSGDAFRAIRTVLSAEDNRRLDLGLLAPYAKGWFTRGTLRVLDGEAEGQAAVVKDDREATGGRRIELWSDLRATIAPGDRVEITAGCDRMAETCRVKFNNFLNFRGFPHIPGEDWLISYPTRSGRNDGGRLT